MGGLGEIWGCEGECGEEEREEEVYPLPFVKGAPLPFANFAKGLLELKRLLVEDVCAKGLVGDLKLSGSEA